MIERYVMTLPLHPHGHRRRRFAAAAILLALSGLTLLGCSQKVTAVDPGFTFPEGRPNADARLVMYPDVAVPVTTWNDNGPTGPDPSDVIRSTDEVRQLSAGAIHGAIFDGTPSTGYQVLRRESNGGLLALKDFVIRPERRFLDSQWELYAFDDPTPSGFTPPSYIGRGVVSDAITALSPLTNMGSTAGTTVADLPYTGNRTPPDTLITMKWVPEPSAVGYWIQIYQFRGGPDAKILSAAPAPFARGETRDFLVAWVPAPADSYKIGRPGALVLTRRELLSGGEYFVRVSAIDAQGRLAAFTYGDEDVLPGNLSYRTFRLGAARVLPFNPLQHEPARLPHASNRRLP